MIQSKLERGLAGLQAGMLGGIVLLVVMASVSVLDRRHWWSYPNVLAAAFYGHRSIGAGFGWHTVSGMALQLLIAGAAGVVFGLLLGGFALGRRGLAFGLMWGVVLYFVSGQFFRVFKPVVFVYLPGTEALVAHLVYGVCLPMAAHDSISGAQQEFGQELAPLPTGNPPVAVPGPGVAVEESTGIAPGTAPADDVAIAPEQESVDGAKG